MKEHNSDDQKTSNDVDNDRKATFLQTFSKADSYDYWLMAMGTLGSIATGVALPVFDVLMGQITDELNKDPDTFSEQINKLCIILVATGCATIFSGFIQVYCWTKAGERQAHRFRVAYVQSILNHDIAWFDEHGGHHLGSKVADVCGKVNDGLTRKASEIIQFSVQIISSLIVGLYFNWKIALVTLVSFPLLGLAGSFMIQTITEAQNQMVGQYAIAGGIATQSLASIRTATALNLQPYFINKYRKYLFEALEVGLWKGLKVGLGNGLMFGVYFLIYALGFWYGAELVSNDLDGDCVGSCTTGGKVLTVFLSITMASEALGQLAPPLSAFSVAQVAIAEIVSMENEWMEKKKAIAISKQSHNSHNHQVVSNMGPLQGNITIQNLAFAYPTRPDTLVCNDVSLQITAGDTIALVGPSGSGKSTIISLLLRFYDALQGSILLDNKNIEGLDVDWVRSQIGYVGQEPILFSGTIAENIAFGIQHQEGSTDAIDNNASSLMEQVIVAAKQAHAHDFIMSFPAGYQTDVGPAGVALSGGQKQRLAIARALIKQPAILLLDEATSALDAASEKIVQESIDALALRKNEIEGEQQKKTTIIIIAHRLSTIRNADKICVFDGGKIVETGKHDDLMSLQGHYFDLVKLQLANLADLTHDGVAGNVIALSNVQEEVIIKDVEVTIASLNPVELKNVDEAEKALEGRLLSKRIYGLVFQYAGLLFVGCLGAAVFGGIFPGWGYMIAKSQTLFYLTDGEEMRERAAFYSYMYILLAGCAFFSSIAQYYGIVGVGERISCSIRSQLYEALIRQQIGFFDRPENAPGQLTTMLAEDSRVIHKAFGESLAKQLMALSTFAISLIFSFAASWKISLVTLATFPLNIAAAAVQMAAFQGQQHDNNVTSENNDSKAIAQKQNPTGPQQSSELDQEQSISKKYQSPAALISSAFVNIRTIHAFSMEQWVMRTYEDSMVKVREERTHRGIYAGLSLGGSNFVTFSTFAFLFWYGGELMSKNEITFEDMYIAILSLMMGTFGLGQALSDLGDQQGALNAAKRVFTLIDSSRNHSSNPLDPLATTGQQVILLPHDEQEDKNKSKPFLSVSNVYFQYPTRPEMKVCEGLSLTIAQGECIALVGPSGCGKSTLINLLLRFYDPLQGQVLLDGQDLRTFNLASVREQIGYVGQEPVLFPGTIAENIAFGRRQSAENKNILQLEEALAVMREAKKQQQSYRGIPAAEEETSDIELGNRKGIPEGFVEADIIAAAKQAHAHDFIMSFPAGYQTDVGPAGVALSGGQKQRLAIARALIKQPAILLLDEATSALDAASEKIVQESIDALAMRKNENEDGDEQQKKTTIIIIAHRLSTIRNADKICVFDGGKIMETGKHEELLNLSGGLYKQLWDKQTNGKVTV